VNEIGGPYPRRGDTARTSQVAIHMQWENSKRGKNEGNLLDDEQKEEDPRFRGGKGKEYYLKTLKRRYEGGF